MDTADKLQILADAARYDVACTSSGVDRDSKLGHLGSTSCAGICHSFSADGRCITLLKVLLTNSCINDCTYCANRKSNDIARAAFSPRELADLTIAFYRRNYIEGLFVSSGILKNPDYTMEAMISTCEILRHGYGFRGYIHAKSIPGASPELVDKLALLADRMSINIELPSEQSLSLLAPDKTSPILLAPMQQLAEGIAGNAADRRMSRRCDQRFAPAGQSTQLIVGATPESDYHILQLSSSLYRSFKLKRVFFSAYMPANTDNLLPDSSIEVPLNREHRLYQADWLMRFYGFDVDEIIDGENPFLDPLLDPKANWALNNLDLFPVEINTAPYEMLLRIPGLGVTGAKRVAKARRHHKLSHADLPKLGCTLKRMRYFITCSGRYEAPIAFDHEAIRAQLALDGNPAGKHRRSGGKTPIEGQLSLFDPTSTECADVVAELGEHARGGWQQAQERAFAAQREELERRMLGTGQSPARDAHAGYSLAGAMPARHPGALPASCLSAGAYGLACTPDASYRLARTPDAIMRVAS